MWEDEPTWALVTSAILFGLLFVACIAWVVSWYGLQNERGLVMGRGVQSTLGT